MCCCGLFKKKNKNKNGKKASGGARPYNPTTQGQYQQQSGGGYPFASQQQQQQRQFRDDPTYAKDLEQNRKYVKGAAKATRYMGPQGRLASAAITATGDVAVRYATDYQYDHRQKQQQKQPGQPDMSQPY